MGRQETSEAVADKAAAVTQHGESPKQSVDFLEKFKTLPTMESLDEQELKELLRISKVSRYEPGALIVEADTYAGWIYYLITGKVRIVRNDMESAILKRTGDVFGDMGPMGGGDLKASAYAVDETTCLKFNISKVDGLPDENRFVFRYAIFRGFAEVLAKRLSITTEKYLKAREELDRLKKSV